jgi:hypothetical protein
MAMKAKELIEKLNKLVEPKPDANVYFYANDETVEFIGKRVLEEKNLSDIELVLSRSYEGGEGLIGINVE